MLNMGVSLSRPIRHASLPENLGSRNHISNNFSWTVVAVGHTGMRFKLSSSCAATCGFLPFGYTLETDPLGRPHHEIPLRELSRIGNELLDGQLPRRWQVHSGAQFAVEKHLIHRRPLKFWQRARELCRDKNDACAFERLWVFLFFQPAFMSGASSVKKAA